MLQIQPEKDIVIEFIKNKECKYVRALGAFYLRLWGLRSSVTSTWSLRLERYCDIILPRLKKREVLEEANGI